MLAWTPCTGQWTSCKVGFRKSKHNSHPPCSSRSVSHQAYMDWGLHTDDVTLARPKAPPHAHPSHVPTEKVSYIRCCWLHIHLMLLKNRWGKCTPTHSWVLSMLLATSLSFHLSCRWKFFSWNLQKIHTIKLDLHWNFIADSDPGLPQIGFASVILDQPWPPLHPLWSEKSFSDLSHVSRIF